MELKTTQAGDIPAFRRLYEKAFPKNEKFPFRALLKRFRKGNIEFLSIVDGGMFVGLMILAEDSGKALLNYFAIDEANRGKGYGSKALALLKERIGSRELFLDIELVMPGAPNAAQREKRKAFYLRNGFTEAGLRFKMFGDSFEMLSSGAAMDMDTLRAMLGRIYGKPAELIMKIVLKPLK